MDKCKPLAGGSLQKLIIAESVTPGQYGAADVTKWMLQAARGLVRPGGHYSRRVIEPRHAFLNPRVLS